MRSDRHPDPHVSLPETPGDDFQPTRRPAEPLRARIYVGLQLLRGRPLGRFLRQLLEWERLGPAAFDEMREWRLRRALQQARAHVPLYRGDVVRHREPGALSWAPPTDDAPLQAWPVLERDVLRTRFEALQALPRPRHLVLRQTSGSTGDPIRVLFTAHADAWNWAHRYRGMMWHGVPIGARALRLTSDRHWLRDRLLGHLRLGRVDSRARYDTAIRFLKDARPDLVSGSPSMLFRLARHLEASGGTTPPVPIGRAGGEQLFPFQRAAIEAHLVGRVVDSYGCTEVGAIAGECPAGSLHVYAENVHVEILRGDEPVAPGEFGDIVLTSLGNPAMPLVRYRVGDRGRLLPDRCRCGRPHPVLADVQARSADTFVAPDGTARHASELADRLGAFFADPVSAGAVHVQLEQLGPVAWRAHVEVPDPAALPGPATDAMERRLAEVLAEGTGAACTVETRFTRAVPGDARKHRLYIPGATPPGIPR